MTMNHIHLAARDVAVTARFYEEYFDFAKESDHGAGVFLRDAAGFLIAIDPIVAPYEFPSWFHVGFCLASASAVFALFERLTNANVAIARDMLAEENEFAVFYVNDPDGIRIEVRWDRA
jgi:catechol-2,3-dioxygenase